MREAVGQYIEETVPGIPSIQAYRFFTMELLSGLYRFAVSNHLETGTLFGGYDDIFERIRQMDAGELRDWMQDLCLRMQRMLEDRRQKSGRSFIARAQDYIYEHYHEKDLSVERVCGYLGLSSAYFSTLFKRETGKTFVNFLTDYRMEQAVQMLVDEDQKTYVIAEAVGYADPNYFSYAFKKKFGMSPSRYKTGMKKS